MQDGIRRMYEAGEDCFYYITMYNEDYPHAGDAGRRQPRASCAASTSSSLRKGEATVQLFGSGPILNEVLRAQAILAEKYNVQPTSGA